MKKIILSLCFGVLMAVSGSPAKAQVPIVHGNANVWFLLLNHYRFAPRWKLGNEIHLRRDAWLRDQQQWIIRPYIDFKLHNKVHLTAGYSYLNTAPYGDYPLSTNQPEHNVWEQVVIKNKIGKNSIAHRYRMEHRFRGQLTENTSGEPIVDGYAFSNRFRYRFIYKRDLNDKFFIHAFDEIWFNFNDKFQLTSFDRNWIYAGLGWKFVPGGNMQIAYLHQWGRNTVNRYERHHSLQFTLQYDIL